MIIKFLRDPQNSSNFFSDKMFAKLNFAFTAYLLFHPKQFEAYYHQIEKEVLLLLPNEPKSLIREIVKLCREQNFLYRYLHGDKSPSVSVELSRHTLSALKESGYLNLDYSIESFNLDLALDMVTADGVFDKLNSRNRQLSIFDLTQIMQSYRGRLHMKPLESAHAVR